MKKEIGLLSLLDYGKDSRPLIFPGQLGYPTTRLSRGTGLTWPELFQELFSYIADTYAKLMKHFVGPTMDKPGFRDRRIDHA